MILKNLFELLVNLLRNETREHIVVRYFSYSIQFLAQTLLLALID